MPTRLHRTSLVRILPLLSAVALLTSIGVDQAAAPALAS